MVSRLDRSKWPVDGTFENSLVPNGNLGYRNLYPLKQSMDYHKD